MVLPLGPIEGVWYEADVTAVIQLSCCELAGSGQTGAQTFPALRAGGYML